MGASIILENVDVTYPGEGGADGTHALDHLLTGIEAGQSLAVVGPSGCGKSTMLRVLSGLALPGQEKKTGVRVAGKVYVNGQLLEGPRRETALILQDFGLLPWKTVYQNAELGLRIRKMDAALRRERTMAALERVGLHDVAHAYPRELSGGMQQRLALARAIAMDVDLLLMDEPLSALDALLRENLQDTLLDLWQSGGYTQVLVTHSIEEAVFLGQRIIVFSPRPARMVADLANPGMGARDYRRDPEFFKRCTLVREALEEARAMDGPADDVDPVACAKKTIADALAGPGQRGFSGAADAAAVRGTGDVPSASASRPVSEIPAPAARPAKKGEAR